MANVQHNSLTDPDLHEPKGVAAASSGKVYVANGAGSGTWHYLPSGWGYYAHNTTQAVTSTPSLLAINGSGSTTETSYLPFEIRGSGNLWNTSTNRITPINIGDSYDVRLDLPITSETGSPTELTLELDIQSGATYAGRTSIVTRYAGAGKATPYTISVAFPIFCLTTFVSNGGQFWVYTDTGSMTINEPKIYIGMNTNGDI